MKNRLTSNNLTRIFIIIKLFIVFQNLTQYLYTKILN
jgi:hypothetical protein